MKSFCCNCFCFTKSVGVYVLNDDVWSFWTTTCKECAVIFGVHNRGGNPTMRQIPLRPSNDVRDMCCGQMLEAVNVNMASMCEHNTQTSDVCDSLINNSYVDCDSQTCESATQCDMVTFSPKLYEKLLPTLSDDEVNTEFRYLQLVNKKFKYNHVNTKKRKILDKLHEQNALDINSSVENLTSMSEYISSCETLIHKFSCEYETTESRLRQVNEDLKNASKFVSNLSQKVVQSSSVI